MISLRKPYRCRQFGIECFVADLVRWFRSCDRVMCPVAFWVIFSFRCGQCGSLGQLRRELWMSRGPEATSIDWTWDQKDLMIRLVSSDIGRKYWPSGPYVMIYGIAVRCLFCAVIIFWLFHDLYVFWIRAVFGYPRGTACHKFARLWAYLRLKAKFITDS